jgi:lipoprotein NlpD
VVGAAGVVGQPLPAAKPLPVPAVVPAVPVPKPAEDGVAFIWPTDGAVLAGFDDAKNKGVDIAGKAGQPVLAAADGRVVYAGAAVRGFGNLIILKHSNTLLSAYAHNQALLVKEDQAVKQGQKIAEMGSSDADRVKLHFEIRRQGKPVDPVKLLPPR